MNEDSALSKVSIQLNPGEVVSHTVVVYIVERLDSFYQEVRFSGSEHTGNILQLGMLTDAVEQAKIPYGYSDDEIDDDGQD